VPALHGKHADEDVAPTAEKYLPALQLVHKSSPDTNLYLPSTQRTHVPLTRVNPVMQLQAGSASKLLEWSWHCKQTPSPDLILYVPAAQAEHDPNTPVYPAGHSNAQSLSAVLPAAAVCPKEQRSHVAAEVAPGTLEYVPLSHRMHRLSAGLP